MTEDEPRSGTSKERTAADVARRQAEPPEETAEPKDPDDPAEEPDKTDMSAVGDDGQVFGG
jgi:hypothetical protein